MEIFTGKAAVNARLQEAEYGQIVTAVALLKLKAGFRFDHRCNKRRSFVAHLKLSLESICLRRRRYMSCSEPSRLG
jgi:hypothetical protein